MESDRTRFVAAILATGVIGWALGHQVGLDTGFGRGAQAQSQSDYGACVGGLIPNFTGFTYDEIGSLELIAHQQEHSLNPVTSDIALKVEFWLQNVAPSQRAREKQACKEYLTLAANNG